MKGIFLLFYLSLCSVCVFVSSDNPTLCGAFSSLWTPASWLMRGISSLKVYRGGLVGSGKLVLLNGSVSSKNWTLQTNVAMVHPCKWLQRRDPVQNSRSSWSCGSSDDGNNLSPRGALAD